MLLEALRDFEWYNEAADVAFGERGVRVTAAPQTDFWQDAVRGYHRDSGHFFFARRPGRLCHDRLLALRHSRRFCPVRTDGAG